MIQWIEPVAGALLMALVLGDVFFTILYARAGTELISGSVARLIWRALRAVASRRNRPGLLAFCGPSIVVALLFTWSILLALGAALVVHPQLGTAVTNSNQDTPTDFVTALYVAGSSLSIVGGSNFAPQNAGMKLLFLANSLIGTTVISLTITYLMQIYGALRSRNTLCLKIHALSGESGDAADLLAHLFADNQLSAGYNNLSQLASEVTEMKEAHHFYPVLFYFRFPEPFYSVSRSCLTLLDAVSLLRSALPPDSNWLKQSGAVTQLSSSTRLLLHTLDDVFLRKEAAIGSDHADDLWRKRFERALHRLREAGVTISPDGRAAWEAYSHQRGGWERIVQRVGRAMAYRRPDLDPAMHAAATTH